MCVCVYIYLNAYIYRHVVAESSIVMFIYMLSAGTNSTLIFFSLVLGSTVFVILIFSIFNLSNVGESYVNPGVKYPNP